MVREELSRGSEGFVAMVKACWADPSAGLPMSVVALRICCPARQGGSACGPSGGDQTCCMAMVRSMLLLRWLGLQKWNKLGLCLKCKFWGRTHVTREMVTGCWAWVAAPVSSDSLRVAELLGWAHVVQSAFVSEGWRANCWVEMCEVLPALA